MILSSRVSYEYIIVCVFKQNTAYEVRISDWCSDVCSSDLRIQRRIDYAHIATRRAHREQIAAGTRHAQHIAIRGEDHVGLRGDRQGFEIGRATCRERVCQYG